MKSKLVLLSAFLILIFSCKGNVESDSATTEESNASEKSSEENVSSFLHDPASNESLLFNITLNQKDSDTSYTIDKQYGVQLQINWELDSGKDNYIAKSGLLTTTDPNIKLISLNYCEETKSLTYFYSKDGNGASEIAINSFDHPWLTYNGSKDKVFRFDTTGLVSYSQKPCDTSHEHEEGSEKGHKALGIRGPAHDVTSTGGLILSKLP